jgi:2-polyprenyl-3-methyl-5-hydroxy-6-metoxy-1,4-benzoquinol methylase
MWPTAMHRLGPNSDDSHTRAAFHQMETVLCPICAIEPLPFAIDHQGFHLCRCPICRLEFANPRPVFEELQATIYREEYYLPPTERQIYLAARHYQYNRQLSTLQMLLKRKGRILDVGCGDGSFLSYAHQNGWNVTGLDIRISSEARELPCRLLEGRLGQIDIESRSFDIIYINHVLEHTQNPLADLEISRQLMAADGLIFVGVPNLAGISARYKSFQSRFHLKAHRWRHYAAIHHLWYFTPASLKAMVEKAGLKTLFWETPVLKKPGHKNVAEIFYRPILERLRCSSILDLYCSPQRDMDLALEREKAEVI